MIKEVKKESIKSFLFNADEVLDCPEMKEIRNKKLEWAMYIGNLEKIKVRLKFAPEQNPYQVETTIWGKTDQHIIIKSGTVIPIKRILGVEIL